MGLESRPEAEFRDRAQDLSNTFKFACFLLFRAIVAFRAGKVASAEAGTPV
jgi:hypothetical protein